MPTYIAIEPNREHLRISERAQLTPVKSIVGALLTRPGLGSCRRTVVYSSSEKGGLHIEQLLSAHEEDRRM